MVVAWAMLSRNAYALQEPDDMAATGHTHMSDIPAMDDSDPADASPGVDMCRTSSAPLEFRKRNLVKGLRHSVSKVRHHSI